MLFPSSSICTTTMGPLQHSRHTWMYAVQWTFMRYILAAFLGVHLVLTADLYVFDRDEDGYIHGAWWEEIRET